MPHLAILSTPADGRVIKGRKIGLTLPVCAPLMNDMLFEPGGAMLVKRP